MRIREIFALAMTAIVLSACGSSPSRPSAPPPNLDDPQVVAGLVTVNRDDFQKSTSYRGPDQMAYVPAVRTVFGYSLFASSGSKETIYMIAINDSIGGGELRYFDSAYDSNGNQLIVQRVSRTLLVVDVTRQYLEANQDTGIRFQISGAGGKGTFAFPSGYIRGFLSVVK